jgi:hypothetical protein
VPKFIVYVAVRMSLADQFAFTPIALSVVVVAIVTAPVYAVEPVVGVVPSRV